MVYKQLPAAETFEKKLEREILLPKNKTLQPTKGPALYVLQISCSPFRIHKAYKDVF
jgi:hypothetical protein